MMDFAGDGAQSVGMLANRTKPHEVRPTPPQRIAGGWVQVLLALAIGVLGTLAVSPTRVASPPQSAPPPPSPQPVDNSGPRSFRDLLALSDEQIAKTDIARLNLLCATGLPGSENLNVDRVLATLDDWAKRVRFDIERHLYQYAQNPAEYLHCEPYYRMMMMTTVIQQDFGVRYNPERARDPDFRDSRDLFIHGLLTGQHTGTCMSMPVLSVALGRRLGYPVSLASAKGHLYVRWDMPSGDHRNFEATSQGLHMYEDSFYQNWPEALSKFELASGSYFRSLTPREELATFMQARGHCLEDNGRLVDAQLAYAHAHVLAPDFPYGVAFLAEAVQKEFGASPLAMRSPRRSPSRPRSAEEMIRLAEEINARNAERTRAHTRPPVAPPFQPYVPYGVVP